MTATEQERPPGPPLPPPPPDDAPPPGPKQLASCPVVDYKPDGPKQLDCPIYTCGNSAKIYGSYVEALDTSGREAQDSLLDPFRIVRGSLTDAAGGCRGLFGLSLEVRGGGFVGVTGGADSGAPATARCSGVELAGARFQLERLHSRRRVTIEIAEVTKVAAWEGAPQADVPAYDLVVRGEPSPGRAAPRVEHLCPGTPHDPDPRAVLVQGETYGSDGSIARSGPDWFNIGCAGSAMSKLRLLGLDPMSGASTAEERQATLKMLTGQYCRGWTGTRDGTLIYPILRDERGGARALRPGAGLAAERLGPIESRWGARGALCVSHLRLWSPADRCARHREEELVERIRSVCQIPACDVALPCGAAGAGADPATVWQTCTVDHVSHASR